MSCERYSFLNMENKSDLILNSIKDGVILLMENPTLVLSVENNESCNGLSKMYINKDNLLVEEYYSNDIDNSKLIISPVKIDNRKCYIYGSKKENFLFICNALEPKIKNIRDIYFQIRNENIDVVIYCIQVYHTFFEDILYKSGQFSKDEIVEIEDILERLEWLNC